MERFTHWQDNHTEIHPNWENFPKPQFTFWKGQFPVRDDWVWDSERSWRLFQTDLMLEKWCCIFRDLNCIIMLLYSLLIFSNFSTRAELFSLTAAGCRGGLPSGKQRTTSTLQRQHSNQLPAPSTVAMGTRSAAWCHLFCSEDLFITCVFLSARLGQINTT